MATAIQFGDLRECIYSRERGLLRRMAELAGVDIGTIKDYVQSVNISVAQALRDYLRELYPDKPRITVWLAALKVALRAGFGVFRCLLKRAEAGDEYARKLLIPSKENAKILAEVVMKYAVPIVAKDIGEYNGIKYPETIPDKYVKLAGAYAEAKNLQARSVKA